MKAKNIAVITFALILILVIASPCYAVTIGDPYYCNSFEDLSRLLQLDMSSVTINNINCSHYSSLEGTTLIVSYIESDELSTKPFYRNIDNEHIPYTQMETLRANGIDISQVVKHGIEFGSYLVQGMIGQYDIDWYQIDDDTSTQKNMLLICRIPCHIIIAEGLL